MNTNLYIYLWFNIESFEIFYVGMGTGMRRFETNKRNPLFKSYFQNNPCAVRLYKTGLSIDEAKRLEIELIAKYNPCCNLTRGGEYSNGEKISQALTGRSLSDDHKRKLSTAGRENWKKRKRATKGKRVAVLNIDKAIVKKFDAKYKVGEWLYNELGIGSNSRSAQRKIQKYFNTKELFNDQFYFVENIDKIDL